MKTLLVVDDERAVTDVIKKLLSDRYNVVTENDGRNALQIIESTALDLIISDMIMPDVDGIELISHIRKRGIRTPVLIMSGNPLGQKFLEAASILGATERLTKPFSRDQLIESVERALRGPHASAS